MTTITINGQPVPATRIDELPSTVIPSRQHVVPAMNDGSTYRLPVEQMLSLIEGGDLDGFTITLAAKATPVDADEMVLADSADERKIKKLTWASIKAALSSIFVTLSGTGQQIMTRRTTFSGSTGGIAVVPWGGEQIEIAAKTASDVAFVTFHIPGIAAANFGMGADNQFRRGGKGVGANSYLFWDHGNVNSGGFSVPTAPTASGHVATKGYVDGIAFGIGQTWQDVTGSRASNTVYQNTTGKPIMVAWRHSGGSAFLLQVSPDNSTWLDVGYIPGSSQGSASTIVPPGWYYKTTGGSITIWSELR